jgi:4-amino-4-deoxy-L-arabinose transferase-like glycosyltransferase
LNDNLKDIRGWWLPGVANFLVISFIVYTMHDDYSFYKGWSFWWRVSLVSFLFGGGLIVCFYSGKTSASGYYENVMRRMKIFWAITLFWILFIGVMPGKMVRSNNVERDVDPGEWSRP